MSYRETIRHAVDQTGEFNRTVSGVTQVARVRIRMEPVAGQDAIALKSDIGGKIAPALVSAIEQSLLNEAQGGGTLGYPMMQVKITILDADCNDRRWPRYSCKTRRWMPCEKRFRPETRCCWNR